MAAQMLPKPIPGLHIGAAREPNLVRPPYASYVPKTAISRRNASAFIPRKSSWDDLARHQLQRRTDHRRSPAGLLTTLVARLFGPAIFEASKLNVLFLGVDGEKHPGNLPRAYTLTHSDITAKLTLAISQTINKAQLQGWYNRLQRDEVVAEWKKAQGKMSLHVHCHISGGHWLLDAIAHLRFYIFRKELPVVLEAFRHGDEALFNNHPELEEALVWVYFHSNVKEFSRVECWGPLRDAAKGDAGQTESGREAIHNALEEMWGQRPERCPEPCSCCYPPFSLIPWPGDCDGDHLPTQS